jgi:hypothetical protein
VVDKIEFDDIDFDGQPEVLASDGSQIVLYSIAADSIYLSTTLDIGKQIFDENIYEMVLADVNRDSITDIAVGVCRDSLLSIYFFKGLSDAPFYDSTCHQLAVQPFRQRAFGLTLFEAIDVNVDGYRELVFSCDSSDNSTYPNVSSIGGFTKAYRSFPDSMLWENSGLISQLVVLDTQDDWFLFTIQHAGSFCDTLGFSRMKHSSTTKIIDPILGTLKNSIPEPCAVPEGLTGVLRIENTYTNRIVCVGNVDTTTLDYEVVNYQTFQYCNSNWDNNCDTRSNYDIDRLSPPDKLVSLSSTNASENIEKFAYHPDFPNFFFAFSGDHLVHYPIHYYAIDPAGGIENIPEGDKSWAFPFNDGKPYLLTQRENTVSLFKLMVNIGNDRGEE